MTTFSRIESELSKKNLTWVWLATAIGASKQSVGNWKSRGIPSKHYRKIADALGKSVDWVEFGEEKIQESLAINITDLGLSKAPGLETTLSHLKGHLSGYMQDDSNREIIFILLKDMLTGKRSPPDVENAIRGLAGSASQGNVKAA